jgi:glycosyltransferase involved in cell wall biosynthesis
MDRRNVLFLEGQPCIRALKYAEGFKSVCADVKLDFAYTGETLSELYGHGDNLFGKWTKLVKEKAAVQLEKIVDSEDIDLIHSHNAPDFLTGMAVDLFKGKIPIIYDIHDLITSRTTPYGSVDPLSKVAIDAERKAATFSDGVIYVTQGVKDLCDEKYPIREKSGIVFESYVPERFVPNVLRKKLSEKDDEIHIVYEGSLDNQNKGSHYDLLDIFKEIASQGIHVHIYSSRELGDSVEDFRKTEKRHFHYHGHKSPEELFPEMTQYDYGWAGFNKAKNGPHLGTVLANKVMEYVACGLPVISFDHKTQKDFINQHGVGIVIDDVGGLKEVLSENTKAVKQNVLGKRTEFTIENNILRVRDFYEDIRSGVSR